MNALILIIMWFVSFGAVVWSVVTRRNHDDKVRLYVLAVLETGVEVGAELAAAGEPACKADADKRFDAAMETAIERFQAKIGEWE